MTGSATPIALEHSADCAEAWRRTRTIVEHERIYPLRPAASRQTVVEAAIERLRTRRRDLAAIAAVLVAGAAGQIVPIGAGLMIFAATALVFGGPWAAYFDTPPASAKSDAGLNDDANAWRAMLEGTYSPALVLDAGGMVLAANAMGDAILPHMQGQTFELFCRAPELLEAIAKAKSSGSQQPCHIAKLSAHHGAAVALVTPLTKAPRAEHPALLVAIKDLTEEEKLSRMRADFVANASHELRTPLTSLKGFIETLQGPARDDIAAHDRFLTIMSEQATRMTHLIDDLLSLSRVEMREHVLPTTRVSITGVLADVARELRPLALENAITLVADLPADPIEIAGDRDELWQVFQNLVENAIKYGRSGGHVWIDVQREPSSIAVVVRDDGMGIAAEHLPRLTERFYRVSTQQSRERGGTGLGLAIVKHVVKRHRGELSITSTTGQGSTFAVKLPLPRTVAGGNATAAAAPDEAA